MASSAFRMAPSKVSILPVRWYALRYSRNRSLNRPARSGRPGSPARSAWSAASKSFRLFVFAWILGSTWIALRRNWHGSIDLQRRFICIRYHRRSLMVGPVPEDAGKLRGDFRFNTRTLLSAFAFHSTTFSISLSPCFDALVLDLPTQIRTL